jgi:hypothetical protein
MTSASENLDRKRGIPSGLGPKTASMSAWLKCRPGALGSMAPMKSLALSSLLAASMKWAGATERCKVLVTRGVVSRE